MFRTPEGLIKFDAQIHEGRSKLEFGTPEGGIDFFRVFRMYGTKGMI